MNYNRRTEKTIPLIPTYALGGALSGGLSGAASGASALSFAGPLGTTIGGVGGAILGMFSGNKAENEMQEAMNRQREQEKRIQREAFNKSNRARIAQYDTRGVSDYNFFPDGGLILGDYEVEGDEVVQGQDTNLESGQQVASDMIVADGPNHQGGGVQGQGGERVYSDRLPVSSFIRELLKSNGLGNVKGKTYAEVAEDLGKKKGKYEEKLASTFEPSLKTAEKMISRVDDSLDLLFDLQQSENGNSTGESRSYPLGGLLPYRRINPVTELQPVGVSVTNPNPAVPSTLPNVIPVAPSSEVTPTSFLNRVGEGLGTLTDNLPNNLGHIANLGNYLGNRSNINNMRTDVNRTLVDTPVYNYRDRSGTQQREIGRAVRGGVRSLESSSRGVNASNIGNLVSRGMDASNQVALSEANRRDQYDNMFRNQTLGINSINAQIANQASDLSRDLENRRLGFRQQNRTAFTQGIMGNLATSRQFQNDENRMTLSAILNDENGVLERFAKRRGESNISGIIKRLNRGQSI